MTKLHPSLKHFDAILRSIISNRPPDLIRLLVEKRSRRRKRRIPQPRPQPVAAPESGELMRPQP